MSPVAILTVQFFVVTLGVAALWMLGTRKVAWSAIWWGVLAFPLSQVARYALLIPLGLLLAPALGGQGSPTFLLVNTILLVITSGLFEETTRWVVLRFWAKGLRTWREGVGFGLGHGGIEAFLVVGFAAMNGIVLLATTDTVRAAVQASDPSQLPMLDEQIAALQNLTVTLAGLGVYERVLAIVIHVACSLLILRCVRTGRWTYWAIAVLVHCGINGLLVALAQGTDASPFVLEAVLTVPVLVLLWAVLRGPLSARALDRPQTRPPA